MWTELRQLCRCQNLKSILKNLSEMNRNNSFMNKFLNSLHDTSEISYLEKKDEKSSKKITHWIK